MTETIKDLTNLLFGVKPKDRATPVSELKAFTSGAINRRDKPPSRPSIRPHRNQHWELDTARNAWVIKNDKPKE